MKSFKCEFKTNERLIKNGAPSYIRGSPFDACKQFSQFEVLGNVITRTDQRENLDLALTEDGGWVAFVCGMPEQVRLFAYTLMWQYSLTSSKLDWHFVNGSRYDKYLDGRQVLSPHMLILDSLLTHPKMHPNASRAYDPARIGKMFDIVGVNRGKASTILLCPDLTPEEAYRISMIQPDFMWNLKYNAEDTEL